MSYPTETLIAGEVITKQMKLAADTYYKGMPLEYDSLNDRYKYLAGGTLAGFFSEDESRTVSANGYGGVILWGELKETGIVDDSNVAYTVTHALIATWAALGFFVK